MKPIETMTAVALVLLGPAPRLGAAPSYICNDPFGLSEAQAPVAEEGATEKAAPPPPPDPVVERYREALREALERQTKSQTLDRHQLRARLALRRAAEVAPLLFITFDGTASHEPRLAPAFLELRELGPMPRKVSLFTLAKEELEAVHDIQSRSPTLLLGPLKWLLQNPDMAPGGFVWESFPSEEVEAMGGVGEALQQLNPGRLFHGSSTSSVPRGMRAAQDFLLAKLTLAARRGIAPRIVVLSHSSGGRAAVQFVESLAQRGDPRTGETGIQIDLVVSFDPVRAAHTTMSEILSDGVSGDGQIDGQEDGSLYKPANAKRWVSFRQDTDTRAVEAGGVVCYGIQGSPVTGADADHEVEFNNPTTAETAHVNIAHGTGVRQKFSEELQRLFAAGERATPPAVGQERQARNFFQNYLIEPYRVYRRSPRMANFRANLDFLVALTFGKRRDAEGYQAFRTWLGSEGNVPALDEAWTGYRRTLLANQGKGSTEGLTRIRGRGARRFSLNGKSTGQWKALVESRMRSLSDALGRALRPPAS